MISICTKIAFADKDERVVDYSIGLLGELQSGTFSSQSSRDLAQFALDCSKAAANRCKAYAALMRIRSEVCSFRPNNDDVEDFVAERKQKIADARKRRAALKDPPSFDHFDWELLQELAAG